MKEQLLFQAGNDVGIPVARYREVIEGQYDLIDNLGEAPDVSELKDNDLLFIKMQISKLNKKYTFKFQLQSADFSYSRELELMDELVVPTIQIFSELIVAIDVCVYNIDELTIPYACPMDKYMADHLEKEKTIGTPALYSTFIHSKKLESFSICFVMVENRYSLNLSFMYSQRYVGGPEQDLMPINDEYFDKFEVPDDYILAASYIHNID